MSSTAQTTTEIRTFTVDIPEDDLADLRRQRSYQLIARAFAGDPGGISRDDVLDNVTHYWLTNTAVSSARLYWESHLAFFDVFTEIRATVWSLRQGRAS